MNYTNAILTITNAITDVGASILLILVSLMTFSVGYLIAKFGMRRLFTDRSLEIGGYYVRDLPFKGYHRFRSKKWNMEHMG